MARPRWGPTGVGRIVEGAPLRQHRGVGPGRSAAAICLAAAFACAPPASGGESSVDEAESSGETGVGPDCERWPEAPRALGRGAAVPVRFVDDSAALGVDGRNFAGTWPIGCPLSGSGSGSGNVQAPCAQLLQAGAAAAEDLDGDGDFDLVVPILEGPDLWLRNRVADEGIAAFEPWEAVVDPGPTPFDAWRSSGVVLFDFDGDGDLDAHMSSIEQPFRLLENLGGTPPRFAWRDDPSAMDDELPHYGYGGGVGDFDRDGDLDLYTTEWKKGSDLVPGMHHARLFVNGGGRFEEAGPELGSEALAANPGGIWVFSPSFVDLDEDGWLDLALVADNHTSKLLFNEGGTRFVDRSFEAGINLERTGMGSTFGDFDGDGHLDWYVTAIFNRNHDACPEGECSSGNRLYLNRGPRCFEDVAYATGTHAGDWGWGATAFDMDNDGDLDLVETNGFRVPYGGPGSVFDDRPMRAWRNEGLSASGLPRFVDVGAATGLAGERGQGRGLLSFDYDLDGDLDLLIAHNGEPLRLLRNEGGEANCSLRVRVEGGEGRALNARVSVRRAAGDEALMVRELGVRQAFSGQSPSVAHVGLGPGDAPVAELELRLLDGRVLRREGVPACSELVVGLEDFAAQGKSAQQRKPVE